MDLGGKKVLLVGLGILGGGVATANFLMREGALLTITDLKKEKEIRAKIKSNKIKREKLRREAVIFIVAVIGVILVANWVKPLLN